MDRLEFFTAAALSGLASQDHDRHGRPALTPEDLGRRAVEMAQGAALALEEIETEPAPTKRPALHDETKTIKPRGR